MGYVVDRGDGDDGAAYAAIDEYCERAAAHCAAPPPGARMLRPSGGREIPAWRLYDPHAEAEL